MGAEHGGKKWDVKNPFMEQKHEFKKTALKAQAKKTRGLLYNQSQKGMNVCCSYPPFILEQKATARLRIYRTTTNGYRHSWTLHDVRDCILVALLEVSAKLWIESFMSKGIFHRKVPVRKWSKSYRGATSEQNTLLFSWMISQFVDDEAMIILNDYRLVLCSL